MNGYEKEVMPARLRAVLTTITQETLHVPDLPLPPPATGGQLKITIPYGEHLPQAAIETVAVINDENGQMMQGALRPAQTISPGDTLEVTFSEENISSPMAQTIYKKSDASGQVPDGYSFAIRATTGLDGGNHPLKGDVWKCARCGALLLPADQPLHEEHHHRERAVRDGMASLNEIMGEMVVKVSDDPEFTEMTLGVLRNSSHALGFKFHGG